MNLLSAFHQQCHLTPHRLAFVEGHECLTYAQFQRLVNELGFYLQQHHAHQSPIAIFFERGLHAAVAIYAVLSVGASYLPLDLKNPLERINQILEDAHPQFIIGQGCCPQGLSLASQWLDIDQPPTPHSFMLQKVKIEPHSIAAILYTSGSTGFPKGIALSHQAMMNFISWSIQTFTLNEKDRIANLAPFYFDLSVFDLFASLSVGASVYIVPTQLTLFPSRFTAWLSEQKISTLYTVPSLLAFLVFKGNLATSNLSALRQILFAGEVFPITPLIKLAQLLQKIKLYNLYGPTETNVCCYWAVDRSRLNEMQAIPIGLPACGAQLSVTTEGQLWVQSDNNFSGYWQQGQLVARKMTDAYATGDRVSYNSHQEYCYHGRLDRMLKCSGYRIEPAEIEAIINSVDGVMICAIIGFKNSSNQQQLGALLVLQTEKKSIDIINIIRQRLPSYMFPVKFKRVLTLPHLANGKIDYQALVSVFK